MNTPTVFRSRCTKCGQFATATGGGPSHVGGCSTLGDPFYVTGLPNWARVTGTYETMTDADFVKEMSDL